jgi:peptide chain release factor 2
VKTAYEKGIKAIEEAEFKSTLNQPEDELPAVLQINSGAGGTESQDWAEMLARMYRMYGEKQGWSVTVLDWVDGDGAGIKTCTLQFDGPFAYGFLKAESGVHRLVRIRLLTAMQEGILPSLQFLFIHWLTTALIYR